MVLLLSLWLAACRGPKLKPLISDFIGLNTHTVQMRPELYAPVTKRLRDYHPVEWDLGPDTSQGTTFPSTRNGVNWNELYGKWIAAGYGIDASLQFESIAPEKWKDVKRDAFEYGRAFARAFGPSSSHPLVSSAEIGNEPEKYTDAQYRTMFESMARGLRAGDPKMLIASCAVAKGKEDRYSKDYENLRGLNDLCDVLNVHSYAFKEQWPTWRRSYPEDPSIRYLKQVQEVIDWRNANAPGKKVWVTEFGWDASTKPAPSTGDFSKWVGSTDTQQAQYLVRSFLVFAAMDVDRAYIFWFNDDDVPQLHGSSGLTRGFKPKPSFYAIAHLQKALGDYRFSRPLFQREGQAYAYEFRSDKNANDRIVAVWSPTGAERQATVTLPKLGKVVRAERMPLSQSPAESVPFTVAKDGSVTVSIGESPVYLWIQP
ncbi:hypothetical protein [Fimbriimonas ginsengisoli]|uniref:Asl1-like glycosyl hydrolase catalytic domain-containing protein n=1 Tax=Fimbriimonas ginsengisoli Gsoil 348 TaxID=661478 RepID=A0A068NKX6_FIMGI|nr:hypothetical protein [Fimbriimonas ginsengisoli]AIE84126.1 hypothetical protein OP10G_0758 [Fimbriimonas ginsengisoli Gsoil 348]